LKSEISHFTKYYLTDTKDVMAYYSGKSRRKVNHGAGAMARLSSESIFIL
jgi:hypothetical protein